MADIIFVAYLEDGLWGAGPKIVNRELVPPRNICSLSLRRVISFIRKECPNYKQIVISDIAIEVLRSEDFSEEGWENPADMYAWLAKMMAGVKP